MQTRDQTLDLPRFGVLLGTDCMGGQRTGIGRVTLEMAHAVRRSAAVADLAFLDGGIVTPASQPRREAASTALQAARALAGRCPAAVTLHAWHQRRRLARAAQQMQRRIGGAVVYHAPNMIARPFDGPTVVTVHDLSWHARPDLHPAERIRWIERHLPATLRQATRFVCVSDCTARDLAISFAVDRGRIDVVSPGVSPRFRPTSARDAAPVLARHGLADRSYVLAVSTIEPRKNFDRLLRAHAMLPACLRARTPLVIAGGRGWGDGLNETAAAAARHSGALRLAGHVPDAELVALYARASVVAYPSLHEGFGLPVLEAMACGAPVVTSDTTALPETAGDAALLVDPLDVDAIAAAVRRTLEDASFADDLRARGVARAARFTWDRMAAGMVASWRRALSLPAGSPRSGPAPP